MCSASPLSVRSSLRRPHSVPPMQPASRPASGTASRTSSTTGPRTSAGRLPPTRTRSLASTATGRRPLRRPSTGSTLTCTSDAQGVTELYEQRHRFLREPVALFLSEMRGCMRPMNIVRTTIVLDAPDLEAESSFWAAMYGGTVERDVDWHSIIVDGQSALGIQLAPNHVRPQWPAGDQQQQLHLD